MLVYTIIVASAAPAVAAVARELEALEPGLAGAATMFARATATE